MSKTMSNFGGYEIVDLVARQRLNEYDKNLPGLFQNLAKQVADLDKELDDYAEDNDEALRMLRSEFDQSISTTASGINQRLNSLQKDVNDSINDVNTRVNNMNATLSNAISSALINAKKYTDDELAKETEARQKADAALQSSIAAESSTRAKEYNTLTKAINDEIGSRSTAISNVNKNINTEASARQSADQMLDQKISSEASTRATAIDNLRAELEEHIRNATGGVPIDLSEYYKKTETYTRDEIANLISAIPKFSIAVVASLPTSGISGTTIYLVKSDDASTNLYTEYIYVNGKWEKLGTQNTDLSDYVVVESLNRESENRVAADNALRESIQSEAETRAQQVSNLNQNMNSTFSALETDIESIRKNLTTEINVQSANATAFRSNLETEITNRTNADAELDGKITALANSLNSSSETLAALKTAYESHKHNGGYIYPHAVEFTGTADHGGFIDFHYNKSTADYTTRIVEHGPGQLYILIEGGNGKRYKLLTEYERPRGTYDGDGSTSRTIDIGGSSEAIIIRANDIFALVTNAGAIGKKGFESFVFNHNELEFNGGQLIHNTDKLDLNTSGVTYEYQVV